MQLKVGWKLIGERTRSPSSIVFSEFLFSDAAALMCSVERIWCWLPECLKK